MQAVRASIFYYLCDAVALRNAVKNWLRFLEQTAAVQGDPLPPDFVGQCIKRFNRTVKTIEIGRNRLTHNPAHSWDDLGHFDPALASEVHRIGSAHEQKSKEQIVDDILDAFLSANAILNSALSETAQAVRPHVQTTAERAGQILREL